LRLTGYHNVQPILKINRYIVEKIVNHLISPDDGQPRFHVKWEGYSKKSDMTWEPEENLIGSASAILKAYCDSLGGWEKIMTKGETPGVKEEDQGVEKKKKRGRPSMKGTGTPDGRTANGKRSKKTEPHPATATPPASLNKVAFKPPTGSWEDDVQSIDACEGTDGKVMVFLHWVNGHRTQHPLYVVYKRCPQKMLKFYEKHLVFEKGGGTGKDLDIADYE